MTNCPDQYLVIFNTKYDTPITGAKNAEASQHIPKRLTELFGMS